MAQFRIPGPLRRLADGHVTVDVEATDLVGAIVALIGSRLPREHVASRTLRVLFQRFSQGKPGVTMPRPRSIR